MPTAHIARTYSRIRPASARAFSVRTSLLSDHPPIANKPEIRLSEENNATKSEVEAPMASPVPWYLQEEAPVPEERLNVVDHLPKIPEDAPEILPNILEYSYKDLGLDNLNMFDLRALEVPAALGANVIMIIGTARSVKNLNVSADRLCRWGRSQYKLSPHADGLLGRNELKIKLRRKAKRARAASQSGAMVDEKDDGITTGWICVNLGVVDKNVPKLNMRETEFEGFGQVDSGISVVVQIFTEEKRAEVDLDGLWQNTLERAERKRLQEEALQNEPSHTAAQAPAPAQAINRVGAPSEQRRGFHTTRRLGMSINDASKIDFATAWSIIKDDAAKSGLTITPEFLLRMYSLLSHENALAELGTGPEDRSSTLFLQLFYGSIPSSMPEQDVASLKLRLWSLAVIHQHPKYSKIDLFDNFQQYLSNGYEISDELGGVIVSALLRPRPAEHEGQVYSQRVFEEEIDLALSVLERLSLRGVPIMSMRVFNQLYHVVNFTNTYVPAPVLSLRIPLEQRLEQAPRGNLRPEWQRQYLARISKMVAAADIPFEKDEAVELMVQQFLCEDYDGFWRLWRKFPLKGISRTVEDYYMLFKLHAHLGDEQRARDCLYEWVPMMAREPTPVPMQNPALLAIMRCLQVAEPAVIGSETLPSHERSHLQNLWYECGVELGREAMASGAVTKEELEDPNTAQQAIEKYILTQVAVDEGGASGAAGQDGEAKKE
ncbi:ATPase synthesis protein 25 [Penicillium chermesinum]|uniref:ATPase synthesis protein 25 n=1 Tax=Penicillium chermesinum TaxID=63820 RepID=A0A9W9TS01_9EURO|nr:ATPase synthesis protein 25 [Penicillium chermesinum]KAJ5239226.1 ATPase synthesis protein 25 [Penicillium chermesinum]